MGSHSVKHVSNDMNKCEQVSIREIQFNEILPELDEIKIYSIGFSNVKTFPDFLVRLSFAIGHPDEKSSKKTSLSRAIRRCSSWYFIEDLRSKDV